MRRQPANRTDNSADEWVGKFANHIKFHPLSPHVRLLLRLTLWNTSHSVSLLWEAECSIVRNKPPCSLLHQTSAIRTHTLAERHAEITYRISLQVHCPAQIESKLKKYGRSWTWQKCPIQDDARRNVQTWVGPGSMYPANQIDSTAVWKCLFSAERGAKVRTCNGHLPEEGRIAQKSK